MKRWRRLPIVLALSLGVAASVGVFVLSASWVRELATIEFDDLARGQIGVIDSDLEQAASALASLKALFEASDHSVSRDEFLRFSASLHDRTPGLLDTVWAPRVTAADRESFERSVAAAGVPDFQISELDGLDNLVRAPPRGEYYPVLYVDSGGARQAVLGLELLFEPVRRALVEKSIATGLATASVPLPLIAAPQRYGGVLASLPVYAPRRAVGDTPAPPAGIVFGVFRTATMVEAVVNQKHPMTGIDLYFFDLAGPVGDRMIYWRPGDSIPSQQRTPPTEQALRALPHWEGAVTLMDQKWGVLALPSAGLASGFASVAAVVPLGIGMILTALVTGYLIRSAERTRRLEALTASLNATNEQVVQLARFDGLTGLPNRASFHDALGSAAARAARGEAFALLCLDLDRFKQVNDTLGHPIGDALLRAVADRLRALVRDVDTVSRLGGDEFTVVQVGVILPENAAALSQRIIESLRAPYDLSGHRVVIGVTIGIALGGPDARDIDTLLRNADLALYRAKQEGRGIYRFFEPEMDARAQARRQLELDLRAAIEHEEFELYYQPLVSVSDRRIVSFEALIRWSHPTRGLVPPDEFVPLAEEIGLIVPIGAWVLRTACTEATHWPEAVCVAVNVSAVQFARADVVHLVGSALRQSGLAPARLELEITESALLLDSAATLKTLQALRELGVRIAMDDFGTGYGSLSYLRSFMFDKLKIDRSFIIELAEGGDSAAIVRAIAGMGRSLGIATTAEGVENEAQMTQLVKDGFTELQGYLFAKPCRASQVQTLLDGGAVGEAAA